MSHSELSPDKKTRHTHSVSICLNEIAAKVWKISGPGLEAVSERIVKVRLHCLYSNITVIAVHIRSC